MIWLQPDELVVLHGLVFGIGADQARKRLRDAGALAGTAGRPQAAHAYEGADLAWQAALLGHGIAETQPFVDGNKRTGLVSLVTFVEMNGHVVAAGDADLAAWMIGLSRDGGAEPLAERLAAVVRPAS